VPRGQQGTVMHYPVNPDKRVCIVYTLFVRQSAASGYHVVKTSRDHISEHRSLTSRTDEFRTDCSRRMSQAGRPANTALQ